MSEATETPPETAATATAKPEPEATFAAEYLNQPTPKPTAEEPPASTPTKQTQSASARKRKASRSRPTSARKRRAAPADTPPWQPKHGDLAKGVLEILARYRPETHPLRGLIRLGYPKIRQDKPEWMAVIEQAQRLATTDPRWLDATIDLLLSANGQMSALRLARAVALQAGFGALDKQVLKRMKG